MSYLDYLEAWRKDFAAKSIKLGVDPEFGAAVDYLGQLIMDLKPVVTQQQNNNTNKGQNNGKRAKNTRS